MKATIKHLWASRLLSILGFMLIFAMSLQAKPAQCTPAPIEHGQCQRKPHCDQRRKFDPEKFKSELMKFITAEANLTVDEARRFFPVYFEMKEKMRNLEHQKERAIRLAAESNMNEKDCQRALSEKLTLEKKLLRVESQYVDRLTKIVGARKLIKVFNADRRFGRKMFQQMTAHS